MKSLTIAVTFLMLVVAVLAWAGAAPWYEWKNTTSGSIVCAQTTPGEGWVKYAGPYEDLRCTTPAPASINKRNTTRR